MEVEQVSLWIEDADADFRCVASLGYEHDPSLAVVPALRTGRATAARLLDGNKTPFTVDRGRAPRGLLGDDAGDAEIRSAAIAPLNAGYGIRGWITVRAPADDLGHFTGERLRLLEGLAYRASVALQKTVLLQSEQESAEITAALLEFSRRLAGTGADGLRRRIVELAGEMLGSPRTWLWLERGRPGSFAIEAAWREDGASSIVPIGSVVEFAGARPALERGVAVRGRARHGRHGSRRRRPARGRAGRAAVRPDRLHRRRRSRGVPRAQAPPARGHRQPGEPRPPHLDLTLPARAELVASRPSL